MPKRAIHHDGWREMLVFVAFFAIKKCFSQNANILARLESDPSH
jgi:hypothetical protein